MSIEKDGAQLEQVKFLQPVAFDDAFGQVLSREVLPKAAPEFKKSTEDGGPVACGVPVELRRHLPDLSDWEPRGAHHADEGRGGEGWRHLLQPCLWRRAAMTNELRSTFMGAEV